MFKFLRLLPLGVLLQFTFSVHHLQFRLGLQTPTPVCTRKRVCVKLPKGCRNHWASRNLGTVQASITKAPYYQKTVPMKILKNAASEIQHILQMPLIIAAGPVLFRGVQIF